MSPQELQQSLGQFIGTEAYHQWSVLFPRCVLTDGAEFLAEEAGAYWLMDAIASHMHLAPDGFVSAKLSKRGRGWLLTLDDGNGNVFARQVIESSDFPLEEITLFVVKSDSLWVIMLTSEY